MGQRGRGLLRRLGAGGLVVLVTAAALTACSPREPAPAPPTLGPPSASPRPTPVRELVATRERLGTQPFEGGLQRLAAAAVEEGAVLVLPPGRYAVGATIALPADVTLRMQGSEITGDLPGQPLVRLAAGTSISGGLLENTSTSPGFDLDVAGGATQVHVQRMRFSGAAANALYLDAPAIRDVVIEDSTFDGVGYAILLNPGAIDARDVVIRRNTFQRVCADAIEINAATGGTPRRVDGVQILDNRISAMCGAGDTAGFGIGLAGVQHFTVSGNVIRGTRNEGVHLEDGTSDGVVRENRITSGGSGRPAIAIYRSTARIVVERNTIQDFNGSAVGVRWDSMGSAVDVTVRSNVIDDVRGDGVVVAGDAGTGPFVVRGNRLQFVGGNGVAVLGSHARSTVTGNTFRGIQGQPVYEGLRGAGKTVVEGNDVD